MRIRTFVATAALAVGLVAFGASGAQAATEPAKGEPAATGSASDKKASEIGHCVQQAVENGEDAEKCVESPSPILPATNELIFGGLSFVIVFLALWKLAWPGIKTAMEGRTERIRADLARADEAKAEAEAVLAQYQQQLAASKTEATRIIEDARATADALKADLQKRAEAEIAEMRQRAAADIESAKTQALADLQGEVAALAIGAAEVVVQKNLDHATQVQLVENYIAQVGTRN